MYNEAGDSGGGGFLKRCFNRFVPARAVAVLPVVLFLASGAAAQAPQDPASRTSNDDAARSDDTFNKDRILGVMPNYATVETPGSGLAPLTAKQKFQLFFKETTDPFTITSAAAGAALSQADNDAPKYGEGSGPYAQRFGAAFADITTQNFFSDAVLASAFHEDPRYFREGPEYGVWHRVGYALSRVWVSRTDSGQRTFNYAGMLGMSMGIALSNAYYPRSSVSGTEVATRFGTSMVAWSLGNLLPEFWPDIHQRFFHHKPPRRPAQPAVPGARPD